MLVEVKFEVRQLHHLLKFGAACESAAIRGVEFYFLAHVSLSFKFEFDFFVGRILLYFVAADSELQLEVVAIVFFVLFVHK